MFSILLLLKKFSFLLDSENSSYSLPPSQQILQFQALRDWQALGSLAILVNHKDRFIWFFFFSPPRGKTEVSFWLFIIVLTLNVVSDFNVFVFIWLYLFPSAVLQGDCWALEDICPSKQKSAPGSWAGAQACPGDFYIRALLMVILSFHSKQRGQCSRYLGQQKYYLPLAPLSLSLGSSNLWGCVSH